VDTEIMLATMSNSPRHKYVVNIANNVPKAQSNDPVNCPAMAVSTVNTANTDIFKYITPHTTERAWYLSNVIKNDPSRNAPPNATTTHGHALCKNVFPSIAPLESPVVAPNAPAGDIPASCASVDRNPCPLPAPNPSDAVNRVSLAMRARFAANTTSYPPSASKHAAPVRNAVHVSSDVGAFDGDVNELANPTPSVAHVVNAKAMAQHESRRERRASGAYTASKLIAHARDSTNESLCDVLARDDHPSAARARRAVAMCDAPVVGFGVHKRMKSVIVFAIVFRVPLTWS
jgi:hypothetical protein